MVTIAQRVEIYLPTVLRYLNLKFLPFEGTEKIRGSSFLFVLLLFINIFTLYRVALVQLV